MAEQTLEPKTCATEISNAIHNLQQLYPDTMTDEIIGPDTRTAEHPGGSMRALMEACNQNDRFKLLDDENVPSGNLDNLVHRVFETFELEETQTQAFKLASLFLTYDSVLAFFVPLLYGRVSPGTDGKASHLSDPLINASEAKRYEYINGVRDALDCLSHSVSFHVMGSEAQIYGRTRRSEEERAHNSTCIPVFQHKYAVTIEISELLLDYYTDPSGYAIATRCAQFRHDFLFAATLIHEMVHAIGVMRRGDTNEPYIHARNPETEWGFAWEHFMFGNIINPQQRTGKGTHILMRKAWATSEKAGEAGGKEYCDVSVSYIAQWFRKETWDVIVLKGPAAIPPPVTHFKIQASTRHPAWVVSCDSRVIVKDLSAIYAQWKNLAEGSSSEACKIYLRLQTHARLQESNVTTPVRRMDSTHNFPLAITPGACNRESGSLLVSSNQPVAVCRSFSPDATCTRKRKADEEMDSNRSKIPKQ